MAYPADLHQEETDIKLFGYFAHWLTTTKIECNDGRVPATDTLVKLWILGDKLLAFKFQDIVLQKLHSIRSDIESNTSQSNVTSDKDPARPIFTHQIITEIYKNTVESSHLRRYVIDAWDGHTIESTELEGLPKEFLADVLNASKAEGKLYTSTYASPRLDAYLNEANLSRSAEDEGGLRKKRRLEELYDEVRRVEDRIRRHPGNVISIDDDDDLDDGMFFPSVGGLWPQRIKRET